MDTKLKSKWIKGYEGMYSTREDGAIYSHSRLDTLGRVLRGRWLKPALDGSGYLHVMLCKDGVTKHQPLHKAVAIAFIGEPQGEEQEVNHIDEDKTNNHVSNLHWCTQSYNMWYSHGKENKGSKLCGTR